MPAPPSWDQHTIKPPPLEVLKQMAQREGVPLERIIARMVEKYLKEDKK